MIRGKRNEAVPSGVCPRLVKGMWKVALSDAYAKSQRPRSVTEIPMAGPLTATIRGLGKSIKEETKSLKFKSSQSQSLNNIEQENTERLLSSMQKCFIIHTTSMIRTAFVHGGRLFQCNSRICEEYIFEGWYSISKCEC